MIATSSDLKATVQMGTEIEATKGTEGFRVEGLPGLSRNARDFLRQRPQEARLVVTVALETAAAQCEVRSDDPSVTVPERLEPFVVRRSKGQELMGVSQAAERLEVSRTTVYDWAAKGMLLAWKSTKRGLSIPAAQILGPGKVVPGLARVLDCIGDPELAWMFLTQEWPFADETVRPLDKLLAGQTDDVIDAAPGFGTTFM